MNSCFNFNDGAFGRPCSCGGNCSCVKSFVSNQNSGNGFNCGHGNGCSCSNPCPPPPPIPPVPPVPPMPPFPPGPVGPVGPQGPIGPVGPAGGLQAYVSYGGNLGTVTTGTTLPLTPIVAEGQNFITTSGNSIVLAPGDYEVIYSFAGTTEGTDTFFTVTPSVNNVPQALYSATNTDTSGTGGANTVGNAFIVSSATASTLNFALTTDSTTGITDSAFTVTVKKLDS